MKANDSIGINTRVKDSLFRRLFGEDKENALSLYNALNNTNYTNLDDLYFTTLEDVVYMKMKNDVSFLFHSSLNLYEHQGTYNPNMPLRGFFYFADLYRQMLEKPEDIYSKKLIKIPYPKYVVFYNGSEKDMNCEWKKLRLSDAFYAKREDELEAEGVVQGEFEWTATMININYGNNKEIMEKCKILSEYSIFISRVKEYNNRMDIESAISSAVEECIIEGILAEFLSKHRREVVDLILTEFDEERYKEVIRKDAWEEGHDEGYEAGKVEGYEAGKVEGYETGRVEGRVEIFLKLTEKGMSTTEAQEVTGLSDEEVKKALKKQ